MLVNISKLNGLLSGMEILNDGSNHMSDYAIYPLPDAASLMDSLGIYFSSREPPQPPAYWHIGVNPLNTTWRDAVAESLLEWFFKQEFSPKVHGYNKQHYVSYVLKCLVDAIGEPEVFEVSVSPPVWYECLWQDFAFISPKGKWILHLGFSS